MIKYKVVTLDRKSYIVAKGSKFCLNYRKGEVIYAVPNSIGIAVFDTLRNARNFVPNENNVKYLRVKPIGKGKFLKYIAEINIDDSARHCTTTIERFSVQKKTFEQKVPIGSIFYSAVKVLD